MRVKNLPLIAFLVGSSHPYVAVWRVGPGPLARAADREASGLVYGLRCRFDPSRTLDWEEETDALLSWL